MKVLRGHNLPSQGALLVGHNVVGGPSVRITGLTNGAAIIGSHASIGASMSDASSITAYKWGSTLGGSEYGTGSSPTDYAAGDESTLYLEVTADGDTYTTSASIRYAFGVAPTIAAQTWAIDDDVVSLDASASGANLTFTYALTSAPGNAAINGSTGEITVSDNGGAFSAGDQSSGSFGVTATDQYGHVLSYSVSYTISLRSVATAASGLGPFSFIQDVAISAQDLSADFTANGNTLMYAISSTALPAGLSVSSAGSMTGTPTAETASASYTVTATDEYGRTTDSNFTLSVAEADVDNPVISSTSFDDATDTADFTTTEGGTLYWAIYLNSSGAPTLNSNGTWTGTTIETGSETVPTSGSATLTPTYTASTGDRLIYGIIDAATNVSNLITETFTPNLVDTFTEATDTAISSYTGETGKSYALSFGNAITLDGAVVDPATDTLIANDDGNNRVFDYGATTYSNDCFAEVTLIRGSSALNGRGVYPAVFVSSGSGGNCYFARLNPTGNQWVLFKTVAGSTSAVGSGVANSGYGFDTTGDEVVMRLTADGTTVKVLIDGAEVISEADTSLTSGKPGFRCNDAAANATEFLAFNTFAGGGS